MRRVLAIILTTALIIFLGFCLYLQVQGIPSGARAIGKTFPEVERLVLPSIIWGIFAVACWEGLAILGLRVVTLAWKNKLGLSILPTLRAMVACLALFFVLAALAFIVLGAMGYLTGGAMLGLLGSGLIALCGASGLGIYIGSRR